MGGIYEYAVEIGSGAMIYIPSFIKIGAGIQKLLKGIQRQAEDRISLRSFFFQNFPLALQPQFGPWPASMKLSVSLRFTRS
jgi:hypothetical protein